jgi:hypothetical protein
MRAVEKEADRGLRMANVHPVGLKLVQVSEPGVTYLNDGCARID